MGDKKIQLDFSALPKKLRGVDWFKSIGYKVPFKYKDISGELEIVNFVKTDRYPNGAITIRYNGKEKEMCLSSFHRGRFERLITVEKMFSSDPFVFQNKYNIGDEIHYRHKKDSRETVYEVLDVYIGQGRYHGKTVKYKVRCKKCNVVLTKDQSFIFGCPCCDNQQCFAGFNDIPTTDPWMIPFFSGNKEEASHYTANSSKKIYPVCLKCGMKSDRLYQISNLKQNKSFKCKYCSDGISFPERFFIEFLNQVGHKYIFQAYEKDVGFKCGKKIYDFYIPLLSCIVETNGAQHYLDNGFFNDGADIKRNDMIKKRYAIEGGIKNYIELNCSDTSLDSLKNEILNSKLYKIFDLKNLTIDWELCLSNASKSLTKEICLDYENEYMSIKELKEKYNIGNKGINNALKRGAEIGWCKYIHNENIYSPIDVFQNGKYLFSARSASEVAKILSNKYNTYATKNMINGHIKNNTKMKGYMFYRIEDKERKREVVRNAS